MQASGERVMQIPDEAMHAGFVGEEAAGSRTQSMVNLTEFGSVLYSLSSLAKRRTSLPAESKIPVEPESRMFLANNNRARPPSWGICGERFVHGNGGAFIVAGDAREARFAERRKALLACSCELSCRSGMTLSKTQNGAAKSGDYQIVFVNDEIAHGSHGQV